MRTPILLAAALLSLLALPAHAIRIDIVQTGGTAIGGSGSAGDTLKVDIVATLEVGEGTVAIFPEPQWDLEGGNVLDLVRAREPASQLVNGTLMTSFVSNALLWRPPDRSEFYRFGIHDVLYPSIAGPEAFHGLEQVSPLLGGAPAAFGPATFTLGSLEFVLNSSDPSEISFYVGRGFGTTIGDENFANVVLAASLGTFRVNAAPTPEPSAWLVFATGLLTSGLRLRGTRGERRA